MDTTVDIGRRIVQMFWDPEPTNDIIRDQPVWCLGSSYRLNNAHTPTPKKEPSSPSPESSSSNQPAPPTSDKLPATPPESTSSSLDSSLAYDEAPLDGGWPPAFLDDFESRIWMTYRSEFDPIPKSQDPKALTALSFSMRLKTQLSDQGGFASDSGWGCMIRSGQSLLANAMAVQRLGRGMAGACPPSPFWLRTALTNEHDTYRLASGLTGAGRAGNTGAIRRRPKSTLLVA
jgi:cysteine protease ATG4